MSKLSYDVADAVLLAVAAAHMHRVESLRVSPEARSAFAGLLAWHEYAAPGAQPASRSSSRSSKPPTLDTAVKKRHVKSPKHAAGQPIGGDEELQLSSDAALLQVWDARLDKLRLDPFVL